LTLLHGLVAPEGDGAVVEVHLDIMDAPSSFLEALGSFGFENDPFLEFFPPGYRHHYTGRMRVALEELRARRPGIDELIAQVIKLAHDSSVRMYAECELVRQIDHFAVDSGSRNHSALDGFEFHCDTAGASSAADIHVEFRSGTVSHAVRKLLLDHQFYWVKTPASPLFPSEEIATVQTSVFARARQVYERLVSVPLPACTGIHLEQKLAMIKSFEDVPLPPVVDVRAREASNIERSGGHETVS
jgi:hypothetical protein